MSYLKALGVFRLVAEQTDPFARLSWQGGVARLHTSLNEEGVLQFFLEKYRPSPIVGPWGARSGFYPGSSESSARRALQVIEASGHERLKPYRMIIAAVRGVLDRLRITEKKDLDKGDTYLRLLRELRNELPDSDQCEPTAAWLDTVYIITDEDRRFPPLLGTGGNEGSGSYMSNFCQLVATLVVDRQADDGVRAALLGEPAPVRADITVGHFAPGAIDGPNSSIGFSGGGGANPWDFLLAIEGSLLFAGAAARRLGNATHAQAAFPFTVQSIPVGYGTAAISEDTRAEIWMPEWTTPVTFGEIKQLLSEGRAQLGRRQASTSVEFARAAVTLGVDRGIDGFHRYSFLKRNGLSFFAAYLGRLPVRQVPGARLLDQLDVWLNAYRRIADDTDTSPRFGAALRSIDRATIDACRNGDSPLYMQAVLRSVGRAKRELAHGRKVREERPWVHPLGELSHDWLSACDDGSPQYRLAVSLASMPGRRDHHRPLRMYLEPVVRIGRNHWKYDNAVNGVVWTNTDLASNLAAVLIRRLREGANQPTPSSTPGGYSNDPLWAPMRFRPALADVLAFIEEDTNDVELTDLLWGLSAIDFANREFRFTRPVQMERLIPTDFALLKLVYLDQPIVRPGIEGSIKVKVRREPPIIALLQAGRLEEALEVACRRLYVSGLPPYLMAPIAGIAKRVAGVPSSTTRNHRLLAALLFPLRPRAIDRLVELTIREPNSNRP
jgi:CRISPR-associated protein Csx17